MKSKTKTWFQWIESLLFIYLFEVIRKVLDVNVLLRKVDSINKQMCQLHSVIFRQIVIDNISIVSCWDSVRFTTRRSPCHVSGIPRTLYLYRRRLCLAIPPHPITRIVLVISCRYCHTCSSPITSTPFSLLQFLFKVRSISAICIRLF